LAFDRMRAEEGVVPSLWWFEVPKHSDRERTAAADYRIRYRLFSAEPFAAATPHRPVSQSDCAPAGGSRFRLLSVYDAAYLELAQREGLPLATQDADLRRAAAGEGVALVSSGDGEDTESPRK